MCFNITENVCISLGLVELNRNSHLKREHRFEVSFGGAGVKNRAYRIHLHNP